MPEAHASVGLGGTLHLGFEACATCGAVIEVRLNGTSVYPDAVVLHEAWHARIAEALEMHGPGSPWRPRKSSS